MLLSRTRQRSDYLMSVVIVVVLTVYSLYWFSGGPDFGARYWYVMLVPCVALTVRGIQFLESTLQGTSTGATGNDARVMVAVLSLCALTLMNYFPWRAIDKYHHYLGMRADIRDLAKECDFGRSIVLIRGNRHRLCVSRGL